MTRSDHPPRQARPADAEELAQYESWLRWMAELEIGSRFRGKFSASDAVQQTMLEAWRHWDDFKGREGVQRRVWLRQILAHQLAQLARHYTKAQKRDIGRERSIDRSLERSSIRIEQLLSVEQASPSGHAIANERIVQLTAALDRLPEDYRTVIELRNLQGFSHAEVAQRMGRTVGATRMLWTRALAALSEQLNRVADGEVT